MTPSLSDDLALINAPPEVALRHWARVPDTEMRALEAAVRPALTRGDDFVTVPFPRIAAMGPASDQAAAEALDAYRRETGVVDPRLQRRVTLAARATALADLCDQLGQASGVRLMAGRSVADEKVTLFCRETPLRDVMRQLGRPFGYTWLRSPERRAEERERGAAAYRYELVQDLRSQLLEEELRNRDRNAALIALDEEMQQYRPYLSLSPDEAHARLRAAGSGSSLSPAEKRILEKLAGLSWGAIQIYFRLSTQDLAALRAGKTLNYSTASAPEVLLLPAEIARGVLESCRDYRAVSRNGKLGWAPVKDAPDGLLLTTVPEARPVVTLRLDHSELGQFRLDGGGGFHLAGHHSVWSSDLAVGISPTVRRPENAKANAKWAAEPALKARVSVAPKHACTFEPLPPAASPHRLSTADVLEALHRETGLPVVADFYTRFYAPGELTVKNAVLFDALGSLADRTRLRWSWDDGAPDAGAARPSGGRGAKEPIAGWLQFRSASFFNDRTKEIPNRLLSGWAASRARHDALTLEDLAAIGQLSDPQLDSGDVAEGARRCFGLAEWDLARNPYGLRKSLRYLATLTPVQRERAQSPAGLPFTQLSLAQQQEFLGLVLPSFSERASFQLSDLGGSSLRIDYSLPGAFEWRPAEGPDAPSWKQVVPPPVRETTRAAALAAARRIDPQATEDQVSATELALTLFTSWGDPETRFAVFAVRGTGRGTRVIAHTRSGSETSTSDGTTSG